MVDAGAPSSAIIDINSQHDITILSIDEDNIKQIVTEYPYFSNAVIIPKGTYSGIDVDITTTGSLATLCVPGSLSDDMVYKMTKALFDDKDKVVKVHEKGNSINLQTAVNGFAIPLHPGALKYYQEMGAVK